MRNGVLEKLDFFVLFQTISLHDRWVAYKGENTKCQDKLFTVKRSSMMQQNGTLEVFLADSKRGDICDFKIKGSWFDKSFLIYSGKTNVIVAEVRKKNSRNPSLQSFYRFLVFQYLNVCCFWFCRCTRISAFRILCLTKTPIF